MGTDIRVGRRDYNVRYKVFPKLEKGQRVVDQSQLLGVLHAKDITPYSVNGDVIGNSYEVGNVRATIETTDRVNIEKDFMLFAIAEGKWYRVENYSQESFNPSQRWSARPIITTRINIVREE